MMNIVFMILVVAIWIFPFPILPIELTKRGVEANDVGYFFLIQTGFNALFGLAPIFLAKKIKARKLIIAATVPIIMAVALMGPSSILGLGDSLIFTGLGLGILGIFFNFVYSPFVKEFNDSVTEAYPWAKIPDKISLIYMASRSIGYWLGPMLGS